MSSIGVVKESKKKLHGCVAEGQHKKDINVTSVSLHGKMTLVLSNKSLFFISAILAVGFYNRQAANKSRDGRNVSMTLAFVNAI